MAAGQGKVGIDWKRTLAAEFRLVQAVDALACRTERDACMGVIKHIIATEPFQGSRDGVDGVLGPAGTPTTVSSQTGGAYATRRPAFAL